MNAVVVLQDIHLPPKGPGFGSSSVAAAEFLDAVRASLSGSGEQDARSKNVAPGGLPGGSRQTVFNLSNVAPEREAMLDA